MRGNPSYPYSSHTDFYNLFLFSASITTAPDPPSNLSIDVQVNALLFGSHLTVTWELFLISCILVNFLPTPNWTISCHDDGSPVGESGHSALEPAHRRKPLWFQAEGGKSSCILHLSEIHSAICDGACGHHCKSYCQVIPISEPGTTIRNIVIRETRSVMLQYWENWRRTKTVIHRSYQF